MPEVRWRNIEDKVDALAEDLSILALSLKKTKEDNWVGSFSAPKEEKPDPLRLLSQ